jgi:hypothetical protein
VTRRDDQFRHGHADTSASLGGPAGDLTPHAATGRGWAYTGVTLGIAASVAANVAHSYVPPAASPTTWTPYTGAVVGAVFWPVALFVAIEIMARTPWPEQRRWTWLRFGGLTAVATVAAIVSYRHQAGLLAFYGEDSVTTVLGPLAVDGLMVMAAGALLATRRTRRGAATVATVRIVEDEAAKVWPWLPDTPAEQAASEPDTAPVTPTAARAPDTDTPPTPPRTPTTQPDNRTRIADLRRTHPDMTQAEVAARLAISERTVTRHWKTTRPTLSAVKEA